MEKERKVVTNRSTIERKRIREKEKEKERERERERIRSLERKREKRQRHDWAKSVRAEKKGEGRERKIQRGL